MEFRSNPKVYDLTLAPGESRTLTFDPVATFCHVQVESPATVTLLLNSRPAAAVQMNQTTGPLVFRNNDLPLRSLTFQNPEAGGRPADVLVITNEVPN